MDISISWSARGYKWSKNHVQHLSLTGTVQYHDLEGITRKSDTFATDVVCSVNSIQQADCDCWSWIQGIIICQIYLRDNMTWLE